MRIIKDFYLRNINEGISELIDIHGDFIHTTSHSLYCIGLIKYGKFYSKFYIGPAGIYDFFYGTKLLVQHVTRFYL
jgi:hypothetical protein